MRITQAYNLLLKELIVASELQFDMNQLFTVINALDKDNLKRPGSVFDWGNTKLNNVNDPLGELSDTTDLQVAVTKNYIKAKFFGTGGLFDPATGNWHLHGNKAILDSITDAGSGAIITSAERGQLPTQDQKNAMDAATAPSGTNRFITASEFAGGAPVSVEVFGSVPYISQVVGDHQYLPVIDFTVHPIFIGKILVKSGTNPAFGSVEVVCGWDGTNIYLMPISWHWYNGMAPTVVDQVWSEDWIQNDTLPEHQRTITFNPASLGNQTFARLMGLGEGLVTTIGFVRPGGASFEGLIQAKRITGTKTVEFSHYINAGTNPGDVKIACMGYQI